MQSQLKILFVDDHVGLRDGMKEMLKSKNPDFNFVCARDYETYFHATVLWIDVIGSNADFYRQQFLRIVGWNLEAQR